MRSARGAPKLTRGAALRGAGTVALRCYSDRTHCSPHPQLSARRHVDKIGSRPPAEPSSSNACSQLAVAFLPSSTRGPEVAHDLAGRKAILPAVRPQPMAGGRLPPPPAEWPRPTGRLGVAPPPSSRPSVRCRPTEKRSTGRRTSSQRFTHRRSDPHSYLFVVFFMDRALFILSSRVDLTPLLSPQHGHSEISTGCQPLNPR